MQIPDQDSAIEYGKRTSRRVMLKAIAAAPLFATFGLTLSPLMRFLKPTMRPCDIFQPADMPTMAETVQFAKADLPYVWTCLPFMMRLARVEFNPENQVIQSIPCFIIRGPDQYVAFSRICPSCKGQLQFITNPLDTNCGCAPGASCCCVADFPNHPALFCPHDENIFDPLDRGRPVHGDARWRGRWLRVVQLSIYNDAIVVNGLEYSGIV